MSVIRFVFFSQNFTTTDTVYIIAKTIHSGSKNTELE